MHMLFLSQSIVLRGCTDLLTTGKYIRESFCSPSPHLSSLPSFCWGYGKWRSISVESLAFMTLQQSTSFGSLLQLTLPTGATVRRELHGERPSHKGADTARRAICRDSKTKTAKKYGIKSKLATYIMPSWVCTRRMCSVQSNVVHQRILMSRTPWFHGTSMCGARIIFQTSPHCCGSATTSSHRNGGSHASRHTMVCLRWNGWFRQCHAWVTVVWKAVQTPGIIFTGWQLLNADEAAYTTSWNQTRP